MNNWWSDNWDKVATLLIGGVVGFFSGILATNQAISGLSERVTKLETTAVTTYAPAAKLVEEHRLKLIRFENALGDQKAELDLTDKLVELHLEKFQVELERVREDTIKVLTNFMKASRKGNGRTDF